MPGDQPTQSFVREVFAEMDAENAAGAPHPEEVPSKPLNFRRLSKVSPAPVGAPVSAPAPVVPAPEKAPPMLVADVGIASGAPLTHEQWMNAVTEKYRSLLRTRSTPDFIDLDLLNSVMADFPDTYTEIGREARQYRDMAEDAEEAFKLWWDGKIGEARARAAQESQKFTSDTGLATYARGIFGEEYAIRHQPVKEANRKAEYLGTLKQIVQESAGVLKALAGSAAFEWSTAGGLKFNDQGKTFFGIPARRIGVVPAPHALAEATKRRGAQPG